MFDNFHPQELKHKHMKESLDHLGKLARIGSCIRDHMVDLHMVI